MSYLGQGNQTLQPATQPNLKDYTHASKTFLSNGYQYTPRLKFLFHVYFNINTANIPQLQAAYGSGAIATIGLMVKNIELPKFKIDTAVMNQYNRKRVVQTKIRYEPSKITFHDDQSDLIRNMWFDYYQYYYGDPSHQYQGISTLSGTMGKLATAANAYDYNRSNIYDQYVGSTNWGYTGETYHDGVNLLFSGTTGKPAFFRDITIYGMSEKGFAQWTLINPLISSWSGDTYNYEEGGGTMQNEMTFEYETVKYYKGNIGAEQASTSVAGFADPSQYDTVSSSITTPYGRNSVYTQSGLVSATQGSTQDLTATTAGLGGLQNVLGAVQQAGVIYNTLTNSAITNTLAPGLTGSLRNSVQGSFPNALNSTVAGANAGLAGIGSSVKGFFFPSATTSSIPTVNNTQGGVYGPSADYAMNNTNSGGYNGPDGESVGS